MLTIEMLEAAHGDALLIEYGSSHAPRRILIDGGPYTAYDALRTRFAELPEGKRKIDLLVVTHIDTDHIDGIIRLLQDEVLGVEIGEVWFNGWKHVKTAGELGGVQGEFLEALLEDKEIPWNAAFGGAAVVVVPDMELPSVLLHGMRLTVLSPRTEQLAALGKSWKSAVSKAHFSPGDRVAALKQLKSRAEYAPPGDVLGKSTDTSEANGSSIALLAEYQGYSMLLAGDGFASVLEQSLRELAEQRSVSEIAVDVFKLPHHGSFSNLTPELLNLAPAQHYLVSTNGDKFKHPDRPAIELVLKARNGQEPTLVFNYLSEHNQRWSSESDQEKRGYSAWYPPDTIVAFD